VSILKVIVKPYGKIVELCIQVIWDSSGVTTSEWPEEV
jgi:ABC-type polysaccharide/polyol phosphate export permease